MVPLLSTFFGASEEGPSKILSTQSAGRFEASLNCDCYRSVAEAVPKQMGKTLQP